MRDLSGSCPKVVWMQDVPLNKDTGYGRTRNMGEYRRSATCAGYALERLASVRAHALRDDVSEGGAAACTSIADISI